MSHLELPGADLYYESIGQGPLLLCISGASGDAEGWRGLAENLKNYFTVVMYDRRGFSRSYLSGAQDYDHRIEADADDAAELIKHLSPEEPATVIGNSSGAVVSFELLLRHPDAIRTLIPHEPPAWTFLADLRERAAEAHDIYNLYRRSGMPPALEQFAQAIKVESEATFLIEAFNPRNGLYIFSNAQSDSFTNKTPSKNLFVLLAKTKTRQDILISY